MAHEIETIAFSNEVPWHGLGNRVDDCVSVDDMLIAAGLNWEVAAHPLFTKVGDDIVEVKTRKALVRSTDQKVLSIIGNNWNPVQNRTAMEFFREYTEAGDIKLETAGSLKGGKVVWGLANLNQGFFVNGSKDAVKGYLLLVSPHEPGAAITIRTTAVRVVCANTMAMAMGGRHDHVFRLHHTTEFTVDKAKEAVGLSRERLVKAELESTALLQLKMSEFDTIRFLAKFFTEKKDQSDANVKLLVESANDKGLPKAFDQVLASINSGPGAVPGTAWGILNGVTHWTDHVAGRKGDYRMSKSWLGENDRLKTKVYNELLELAA